MTARRFSFGLAPPRVALTLGLGEGVLTEATVQQPPRELIVLIGPKGAAGEAASLFEFVQSSPLTSWTVNHNLGRYPDVTVLSVGGAEVEASITSTSINQTIIQFTTPFAGRALMR